MKQTVIDVSILIPTWNGASLLEDCIMHAARACGGLSREILVFDNGSSDGTWELLLQLEKRVDGLMSIRSRENLYFARAVNQLAERARGRFFLLLNNDVFLDDDSVPLMVEALEGDERIGVVAPQLRDPDGTIQKGCRRLPTFGRFMAEGSGLARLVPGLGWRMAEFDHNSLSFVEQPMMSAFLVKKSCWLDVGGLDERFPLYFNDVDWCKRALDRGWRILFCPSAGGVHLEGWSGRRLGFRQVKLSAKGLHAYFLKHHISSRFSPRYLLLLFCCSGLYMRWLLRLLLR